MHEMLFIRDLKPNLNVQSDSIRAKSTFIIFAPVMLIRRAKIALNAVIQFACEIYMKIIHICTAVVDECEE